MKALISFWKKDIINKLIILIASVLIIGLVVIGYLLATIKSDSIFYSVFAPGDTGNEIPTLAPVNAKGEANTPAVFPTYTSVGVTSIPTQKPVIIVEQPTGTLSPATNTPEIPTVNPPTLTPTPEQPTPTVQPVVANMDVAACIPQNPSQSGKVIDVIDGNTVKVLIDGAAYTVRYIGIDVPSYRPIAEYFGQEADFKNAEYVFAKEVTLIPDAQDRDESGRLLRYVKLGDVFVNYSLVSGGFATVTSDAFACFQTFKAAEQSASALQLGLWKPTPTIPSP